MVGEVGCGQSGYRRCKHSGDTRHGGENRRVTMCRNGCSDKSRGRDVHLQ